MKVITLPTCWTPEQAIIIHEFLVECQAAVWQAYQQEIAQGYDQMINELADAERHNDNNFDDDFNNDINF